MHSNVGVCGRQDALEHDGQLGHAPEPGYDLPGQGLVIDVGVLHAKHPQLIYHLKKFRQRHTVVQA